LPPVENAENPEIFPRIELIYTNACKALNGEDIDDPNEKDKKKQKAPPKKEDKKKKGKEEPVVEEKEPTEIEKEMKDVLATEKRIMKYRLFMIKCVAISRLKEMRNMAK